MLTCSMMIFLSLLRLGVCLCGVCRSPVVVPGLSVRLSWYPMLWMQLLRRLLTQLNISFKCKDPLESLTKLNMYISDIRVWMIKNKLKINDSKTKFIIFLSPLLKQNLSNLSISVGDSQVFPSFKVRDLGVVFDQYLTFHDHIGGICKSTHFHLRSIGRIRNLLYNLPNNKIERLQRIQKQAACM